MKSPEVFTKCKNAVDSAKKTGNEYKTLDLHQHLTMAAPYHKLHIALYTDGSFVFS